MSFKHSKLAAAVALCMFTAGSVVTLPSFAADKGKDKAAAEKKEDEKKKWNVLEAPGEKKTVTIDTDETTWSNLDVSPDGKTIIFDMLGDLYTMDIKGGEAKPLTNDMAWNTEPRFSPNGKQIAFISDREGGDNIWLMDIDGKNLKKITDEKHAILHNPYWSPDGNYILGKQSHMTGRSIGAGSIWMYHKTGGKGVELRERLHGKDSQKTIAEPAFSPDGRYVYYALDGTPGTRWEYNKNATGNVFQVRRWDTVKGEEETLISGAGGAIRPTPSHNGKYLAFVKRVDDKSAIYIKNLASGVETELYVGLDRDLQETNGEHGNTAQFAWTPNDKDIVFWSGGKFHSIDVNSGTIKPIPVRVKVQKQVTEALKFAVDVAPDTFKVKMARWTQVSPDGKTAMFQALGYIYLRDIDSGKVTRLTKQNDSFEYYPSFSRDGKKVVYTTWNDQKHGEVRVANVKNGKSKRITMQKGHYIQPAFSPDGDKVLYKKVTGGYLLDGAWSMKPGIYMADVKGTYNQLVTKSGDNPHFADDGQRIFFSAYGEENELILKSVDLRGKEERTHYKGSYVTDYRVSPDGKWIAFQQHFNTFVAPFMPIGKTMSIGKGTKNFPVVQVSKTSGDYLNWRADSKELTWAFGPTLYRRELKDAFSFLNGAPETMPDPVAEGIDVGFMQKADKPQGMIALVGGRVVTMRNADSEQEVIENGVVLIENNRIKAVGKQGDVQIPSQAKTIDISGKTVIPGLIDVHAHGSYASYEIQPQQNWGQYSNLSFGVTTIHDPSNNTSEVFSMAELAKAGKTVSPRIFSVGRILYAAHAAGYKTEIDNLEDAKFHVKRLKDAGAISVKSYNHPRRDTRQQVLTAAREMEMMVFPEGGAKFQHNMNMVVDGHTGVEHALPVSHVYSDVVQMWGQTKAGYTPTFVVAYGGLAALSYYYEHTNVWQNERLMSFVPREFVEPATNRRNKAPENHYNFIDVAEGAKKLRDAGVGVHIGAHGEREGVAAHWEVWSMVQGGFTPWEALRGGTIDGAKYLSMEKDLGSIEAGKLADLAIIDGNPLENIRQTEKVTYTVINGRVYDSATMNEIGNVENKRNEFFFENNKKTNMHPATKAYMEEKSHQYHWKH